MSYFTPLYLFLGMMSAFTALGVFFVIWDYRMRHKSRQRRPWCPPNPDR